MKIRLPELLIPAGNLNKLRIAYEYGADAVYVGAAGFSMRPDGASFAPAQLEEAAKVAHRKKKKLYVGVNSLVLESELDQLNRWFDETAAIDFDGIIVSDPGVFRQTRARRPNIEIHISTQASTANSQAAAFWKDAGAARVILARECTLADSRQIVASAPIDVEVFVHGAMCVAVSGRCLLSAYTCGQSASRGACKHSCRWDYQLVEEKRPGHTFPVFETGKETIIMGSTDLCLIDHIPQLVDSGFAALKVEGRMKNEHFVAVVTSVYRAALDAYARDPENYRADPRWRSELETVSHRPYRTGFAFGYPFDAPGALQAENRPHGTRLIVGMVRESDDRATSVHVKHRFKRGDILEWIAPGLEQGVLTVESIIDTDNEPLEQTTSATNVFLTFKERTNPLPPLTILRRERD